MANNEYTAKFRVDISDLKKNITEANKQIKLANATFKAETAGMEKWEDSADGIASKLKQLREVIRNQKTILESYEQQLERQQRAHKDSGERVDELKAKLKKLASEGVDKASDEYKALETELKNAMKAQENSGKSVDDLRIKILNQQAAIKKNEAEVNKLEDADRDLGNQSRDTGNDVDKLGNELDKAGREAKNAGNDGFTVFKGVLANLTTQVINKAVEGLKNLGEALLNTTLDAAQYADDINTLSKKTGMSTDALQEYQYAAELIDVSLETLSGSMAKNIKSMSNAANGSEKFSKAYDKLGIKVTDAEGNLRDSQDVFWETIDALGQIEDETERDATAMQIFGKSAQELNPLIMAGSKAVKDYAKEARKMGAVMSTDQLNRLNDLNDTMDKLKVTAGNAKNAIGLVLLPSLQSLADDGVNWLGEFTKQLQEADGDMEKVGETFGNSISVIAEKIGADFPKLAEVALSIVGTIVKNITSNLPQIFETGREIIKTVLDGIVKNLPDVLKDLTDKKNIRTVVDNLVGMISDVMKFAAEIVAPIAQALPDMITSIIKELLKKENVQLLIEGFTDLLFAVMDAQGDIVGGIIDAIPDMIESIFNTKDGLLSFDNIEKFVQKIIKMVGKIVASPYRLLEKFFEKVPEILLAILEAFISLPVSLFKLGIEAGGALINGIKEGIESLFGVKKGNVVAVIASHLNNDNLIGSLAKSISGRKMAKGGVATRETTVTVADDGAEAIIPLEHNTGWIKQVTRQLEADMKAQNMFFGGASYNNNQKTINFTQINNSPKELSRIDIYRDTENMLSLVRGSI